MKSFTTKDIPEGMWIHWGRITPRDLNLNRRSRRLYAADVACHHKTGKGIIETAIDEEIINEQDINDALELGKPDEYDDENESEE